MPRTFMPRPWDASPRITPNITVVTSPRSQGGLSILVNLPHELLDRTVPFSRFQLDRRLVSTLGGDSHIASPTFEYQTSLILRGDLQPKALRSKMSRCPLEDLLWR